MSPSNFRVLVFCVSMMLILVSADRLWGPWAAVGAAGVFLFISLLRK